MYAPAGVKVDSEFPVPDTMKAWVLGNPGELSLREKPVPTPKRAEVLAAAIGDRTRLEPLGAHALRGVRESKEIFALRL